MKLLPLPLFGGDPDGALLLAFMWGAPLLKNPRPNPGGEPLGPQYVVAGRRDRDPGDVVAVSVRPGVNELAVLYDDLLLSLAFVAAAGDDDGDTWTADEKTNVVALAQERVDDENGKPRRDVVAAAAAAAAEDGRVNAAAWWTAQEKVIM